MRNHLVCCYSYGYSQVLTYACAFSQNVYVLLRTYVLSQNCYTKTLSILTITRMLFSNVQGKCTIVSSCRACYYFHHSSPRWFTKSVHVVVSFQPAGKHLRQTFFGIPRIIFLNHFEMSGVNSKTSANSLPTINNWHHLFQYIKEIIFSYQGETIMYAHLYIYLYINLFCLNNILTNLMENHPLLGALYPPVLTLHGEQFRHGS